MTDESVALSSLFKLIEYFKTHNWLHYEEFKRITGYDEKKVLQELEKILGSKSDDMVK